jgi:putative ABC transport system substrate-binding protein
MDCRVKPRNDEGAARRPSTQLRRREFITLLGAGLMWPLAARAALASEASGQRGDSKVRMRYIGVLMGIANNQEGQRRIAAFRQALQELGWTEGREVGFEYRWGAGDVDSIRAQAAQLIALQPDLILANSTIVAKVLKQETPAIPTVFVQVADPVRDGIVASLARPGGNITGFTSFEYTMGGKWLETLKEIAPAVARVALLHYPQDSNWPGFSSAIERVAPSFGVQLVSAGVSGAGEIESAIGAFAKSANGGLIVLPTPVTNLHRKLIFAMAARHRLPAVYPFRFFAADGGLVSYGFDSIDPFRRAASYANRILKGEKPGDLPVQAPVKYELVINLKTAKALDLDVPPSLLAVADEVIE